MGFSCSVRYRTWQEFAGNLRDIRTSDVVVFHRLQFPVMTRLEPPTELLLLSSCRTAGKITVFDIDDAIFLDHPLLTELFASKCDIVTVGSHQLASFALRWNKYVQLLPSSVDAGAFRPSLRHRRRGSKCILSWHGTAYVQLNSLRILIPVLKKLATRYDIVFKLLGTMGETKIQDLFKSIPGLTMDFGPSQWVPYGDLPALIEDVDIGLSPLTDTLWSRSKCAMKALEYMSMAIPVVASPVGEHNYLIRDSVNGLLASSEEEWVRKIGNLIEDRESRDRIGQRARETVLKSYSLGVVAEKFASIIRE